MCIQHTVTLLKLCLKSMFSFQVKDYEQVHGAAMGSPISPLVANLFRKSLNPKPSALPPVHPGFGSGMWMILLSSNRQT